MLELRELCNNGTEGFAKSFAFVPLFDEVVVEAANELLFSRECLAAAGPDEFEPKDDSKGLRSLSGFECTGALGVVSPPEVSRREFQNEPSMLDCLLAVL